MSDINHCSHGKNDIICHCHDVNANTKRRRRPTARQQRCGDQSTHNISRVGYWCGGCNINKAPFSIAPKRRPSCYSPKNKRGSRMNPRKARVAHAMTNPTAPPLKLLLLLTCFLTLLPPLEAMIYLEDVDGALRYDALPYYNNESPPPPGSWMQPPFQDIGERFKLGTPEHYSTVSTGVPTGMPTGMSSMGMPGNSTMPSESPSSSSSSMDALSSVSPTSPTTVNATSNTFSTIEPNNTTISTNTNPTTYNHTNSSIFDRTLNTLASSAPRQPKTTRPTAQPTTTTPTTTLRPSSSPTYTQPPSTQPSFAFPTKSPSVIPEITGEFTEHLPNNGNNPNHPPNPNSNPDPNSKAGKFTYFNDLQLIHNPKKIVYWDSKQARFGSDLGPRGNAAYVNIVLPPRWGAGWQMDELGEDIGVVVDGGDLGNINNGIASGVSSVIDSATDVGGENVTVENGTDLGNGTASAPNITAVEGGDSLTNMTHSKVEGTTTTGNNNNNTDDTSALDSHTDGQTTNWAVDTTTKKPSNMPSLEPTLAPPTEGRTLRQTGTWANKEPPSDDAYLDATNSAIGTRDQEVGLEKQGVIGFFQNGTANNGQENNNTGIQNRTTDDNQTGLEENGAVAGKDTEKDGTTHGIDTIDANTTMPTISGDTFSQQQQQQPAMPLIDSHHDHISDYFCLEDFVRWRIQERNSSRSDLDDSVTSTTPATVASPAASAAPPLHSNPNNDVVEESGENTQSTAPPPRPLTILVKRGRCSFESKAKMAMVLNDLLRISGRSNRIENLIVYNNGTAPVVVEEKEEDNNGTAAAVEDNNGTAAEDNNGTTSTEDIADSNNTATEDAADTNNATTEDAASNNNTTTDAPSGSNAEEQLIVMSRLSQKEEENAGDDITVGLVYVTTSSGRDLLRRMREREVSTGVGPYMDVSMLFPEDERGRKKRRRMKKRERMLEQHGYDGSTKDGGDYNTVGQESHANSGGYHDAQLVKGWFFPATLTKFCLSCGESLQYGFNSNLNDNTLSDDGFGGDFPLDPNPPTTTKPHHQPPILTHTGGRGRGQYTDSYYYSKPWLDAIRKTMIVILSVLLVGPLLLAMKRWYTVGGTFRITRDENGSRRLRVVSPNLEVFVNGVPGTVETNGTKLDRAQVFSLPEVEYVGGGGDGGEGAGLEGENDADVHGMGLFLTGDQEGTNNNRLRTTSPLQSSIHIDTLYVNADSTTDQSTVEEPDGEGGLPLGGVTYNNSSAAQSSAASPSSPPPITVTPSRESSATTGRRYVSSTTCSICIDEFIPGELVRVLPRCDHAFHTECILPWLTERQGCCPMCKVAVLPDELQRGRGSRSRRGGGGQGGGGGRSFRRSARGVGGGQRRHRPQSTPRAAAATTVLSTTETSEDSAGASRDNSIVSGVRLVSEIESDLAAAAALPPPPRVVTPDGPPRSSAASGTVVPFGTEGSAEIEEGSSFLQDDDVDIADLVVLEQGHRPTTTSGDESDSEHDVGEAPSLPESHDIASIIIRAHQQDNATDNDHGNTSGTDGVIIREYSEIGDDTFATTAGSDGILPDEGSVDDASREVDRESGPILRIDDE